MHAHTACIQCNVFTVVYSYSHLAWVRSRSFCSAETAPCCAALQSLRRASTGRYMGASLCVHVCVCVCVCVCVLLSQKDRDPVTVLVEEACPAGLHHSGFSCGNHQPKVFFEIPDHWWRQQQAAKTSGSLKTTFGWWFPQENPVWLYCDILTMLLIDVTL